MYQILIYTIVANLWRWEIRYGGALIRCGTPHTKMEAENQVHTVVSA